MVINSHHKVTPLTHLSSTKEEINRSAQLISEISELVVRKHEGSLKAEHGRGRNMAPFVEME